MTRRPDPDDYYGRPAPDLRTSDAMRRAMRAYLLARDGRACARCGDTDRGAGDAEHRSYRGACAGRDRRARIT